MLTFLPPKQALFIGATSGDLISLGGVLVILSCFCFTLRTMFISSLRGGGGGGGGGGGDGIKFKNSIFFLNPTFVSPYLF